MFPVLAIAWTVKVFKECRVQIRFFNVKLAKYFDKLLKTTIIVKDDCDTSERKNYNVKHFLI